MTSPSESSVCGAESSLDTAVAFLVFNRPELTARVLAAIRAARPKRLLVVADGPRADRPGEHALCAEVRRLVDVGVDWPCKVEKNYSETNLGCGRRVSSGLDWVFEQVEEAIILEDDCLPDPTFFSFCEELLVKFRKEERVAHISGTPNYWDCVTSESSYVFSRYGSIWGWATWRRAWVSAYDLRLADWPRLKAEKLLASRGMRRREIRKREAILDRIYSGDFHSWDYQWSVAKWRHGWLSVVPSVPLIHNLGMEIGGAHMPESGWAQPRLSRMEFPLRHADSITTNTTFDEMWADQFAPSLIRRAIKRLGRLRIG